MKIKTIKEHMSNHKKMVIITEVSSEETFSIPYSYDDLPPNTKYLVDVALGDKFNISYCDVYKVGLQYLLSIKHPQIQIGDLVEYMGSVTLIDE